ncbi:hypothetical protein ULMS_29240 [Patiriisocius marinistellae]|uniref:Uncharacterized protein n=1 Tax=Patiriisocius marinistellae TaxID=2494560 RepID=A0A5J4G3F9_9FLAO|nr:hypothetical protein [Patiriisocius marinistellae]GEQ87416.1 hypothetical protein ULMS_29240 [Patiriisocius marinistellae]
MAHLKKNRDLIKIFQKSLKKEIAELSNDILNTVWSNRIEQSNFESLGIKNGKQIIAEYLENREYGIAYEHLAYLITECEMELSVEQKNRMDKIAYKMNVKPIRLLTNEKGTDFLFGCRNLYLASIHPFDFDKRNLNEYKQIVELGKELLAQKGIQNFLGYLMESQYRVSVWASMIAIEYGKPKQDEILNLSGTKTIINSCLECIIQDEIEPLSAEMIANKENWVHKNVPQQRIKIIGQ